MHVKDFAEAMKNLPARFSNLTFWRECRKLKDSVVGALEYLNDWGISIENELDGKLPKSPTDWEAWTIEEQAEARERIGDDAFEQICDITLEEDSIININLGCECECLIIIIKTPSTNSISGRVIINSNDGPIIYLPTNALPSNRGGLVISYLHKQIASKYWITDTAWGSNNYVCNYFNRSALPVNGKSISMIVSNRILCAGTEIEIYGARVS